MDTHGGAQPSFTTPDGPIGPEVARPAGAYIRVFKPVFDRALGLLLLILFGPLILLVGLFVRMKLGRPVFYSQDRIGLDGAPFRLHKIRTMMPDRRIEQVEHQDVERRSTHKSPGDPRVDPAARIIRAMRLDELPQFWNVVKGDMSLVGPRPELPEIVGHYEPWQHRRHLVKPGVTGPWQISHHNGQAMHECTQIDLEYLTKVSLLHDLKILARTPAAMIGNRKGY